jgi:hypothetical protein
MAKLQMQQIKCAGEKRRGSNGLLVAHYSVAHVEDVLRPEGNMSGNIAREKPAKREGQR